MMRDRFKLDEVVRSLIRLYPQGWRDRYEDEFLAMLDQMTPTFADAIDIFVGAADAHIRNPKSREVITMLTRRIALIFVSALLVCCVGAVWLLTLAHTSVPAAPTPDNVVEVTGVLSDKHVGPGNDISLYLQGTRIMFWLDNDVVAHFNHERMLSELEVGEKVTLTAYKYSAQNNGSGVQDVAGVRQGTTIYLSTETTADVYHMGANGLLKARILLPIMLIGLCWILVRLLTDPRKPKQLVLA